MKEVEISRKRDIKRAALAVAMTAFISQACWAASVKTDIVLTEDVLTVGDVFDGVTQDAGRVLAPAPAFGKTMVLGTNDLARISNAFNLGWEAPASGMSVTIRRDASIVDGEILEQAIEDKLAEDMPGRRFDVSLEGKTSMLTQSTDRDAELSIAGLKVDLSRNVLHAVAAKGATRQNISAKVYPVTEVPVLSKALRSGDVITLDDIQYIDMRDTDVSVTTLVSVDSLVGQTPRRGIPAMKPVTAGDVTAPMAVKKGEIVTMTLQSGTMQLTAQGRSLDNGAAGEVVRVMNTSSNQIIEAVVKGQRTVSVTAPAAALEDRS
jgi:flagella basal body P-ring formation protein FlgA